MLRACVVLHLQTRGQAKLDVRRLNRRDTVIWGEWVVGARARLGAQRAGVGGARGGGGGVNIRGLVYCVNEVHLFPWKMAPGVPGAAEKAGGVFRFRTLSRPLSRFHVFEHFIKTPKPSHGFRLVVPVLGGASFSELLSDASLFLAGTEERREEGLFLVLLRGHTWEHAQALGEGRPRLHSTSL